MRDSKQTTLLLQRPLHLKSAKRSEEVMKNKDQQTESQVKINYKLN